MPSRPIQRASPLLTHTTSLFPTAQRQPFSSVLLPSSSGFSSTSLGSSVETSVHRRPLRMLWTFGPSSTSAAVLSESFSRPPTGVCQELFVDIRSHPSSSAHPFTSLLLPIQFPGALSGGFCSSQQVTLASITRCLRTAPKKMPTVSMMLLLTFLACFR